MSEVEWDKERGVWYYQISPNERVESLKKHLVEEWVKKYVRLVKSIT